jgi:hypothetical protein
MKILAGCLLVAAVLASPAVWADGTGGSEFQNLDNQVQGAKEEVLQINHELMLLQEKLLHPSSTELSLFLALKPSGKFSVDSAALSIDGKIVDEHLYTYRELEALRKGGVQRLHTTNVVTGPHQISLTVKGHTGANDTYSKTASFKVNKQTGPRLIEFTVVPGGGTQPAIKMKVWQ